MGAAALNKTYNISVSIQMTRGKGEIDVAQKELDRLHNLLGSAQEVEWAKTQIETITRMILLPNAKDIKHDLEKQIADSDLDV